MLRLVFHAGWIACVIAFVAGTALPHPVRAQDDGDTAAPDVAAQSAIVVDATTGEVLFSKDAHLRLPPASLTKLFTALVALESAPLGRQMSVAPDDLVGEASMGLMAGENLSLDTLLYGLLLPSGNDAASTIARNLGDGSVDSFVSRMNERVAELGLADTALINPHGLDAQLHYSSARDLAAVTMFMLQTQPDFARISGALERSAEGHTLYQTNDLHVTYPGIVAGKTGVTDEAGYCLMEVAERDGRRVIAVLLGSTSDAWYGDAQRLLDYGFAALATPGRLPATDVISIGSVENVAADVPAAVQQNAAQTPNVVSSLQVIPIGKGTSLVSEPTIASSAKRSPWLWLTFPLILVAGTLGVLAHLNRVSTRRPRHARRLAPHESGAARASGRVVWDTAPLQALGASSSDIRTPLMYADDEPDLHLIWDRATRERLLRGRAAVTISIGD